MAESKSYHEQVQVEQTIRLREVLKTLPPFAKDFFRAIEPKSSAKTRINYAYDIPLRMGLFGFSERFMMRAKIIAQVIVLTAALAIYTLVSYTALDLEIPSFSGAATLVICLYLMGVIFFILAHGLANIFRKFGPTYALAMILYFGIMVLCGMMGIQTDQLPGFLQKIAALLPMSYVSSDFIDLWQGGSYNFMPLIQSFLFMGAISGILLLYANYKNRRTVG